MSAFGVVPEPRARVAEVGRVTDLSGQYLTVGYRGGCVTIAGHVLNQARSETFMRLLMQALWYAAKDEGG